jgi:hypothetical protein
MKATRRASRRRAARRGARAKWTLWGIAALVLVGGLVWWLRPVAPTAPPLDEIDEASRARLDAVLREADRNEAREP